MRSPQNFVVVADRRSTQGSALEVRQFVAAFAEGRWTLTAEPSIASGEFSVASWATRSSTDIAAAYRANGAGCCEALDGEFSLAVVDQPRHRIVAGRDPLGARPCYVYRADGVMAVATAIPLFRAAGLPLTPSTSWAANYITKQPASRTATAFEEVTKLPPGHRLIVDLDDLDAPMQAVRWHEFTDDSPFETERNDRWVDAYRSELWAAVERRVSGSDTLGVESSGGIDSSSCLGVAAEQWADHRDDIHEFGHVRFEDEPEYIRRTGEMHGIEHSHMFEPADEWRGALLGRRTLEVLGHPPEHGFVTIHESLYEVAQATGVEVLLSGFGGDECVTFPASRLFDELVDRRLFLTAWRESGDRVWQRTARFVRAAMRHVATGRRRSTDARVRPLIESVLLDAVVVESDIRGSVAWNHRDDEFRTINQVVLGKRIREPFVVARLEECAIVASSYGLDQRWPLLDAHLIQQYLSTPSIEKRRGQMGRYLHRRAIDGVVPPEVQWKPTKSMGRPLWPGADRSPRTAASRALPAFDALHPVLRKVVDPVRWAEAASGVGEDGERPALAGQIHRVLTVDRWLDFVDDSPRSV